MADQSFQEQITPADQRYLYTPRVSSSRVTARSDTAAIVEGLGSLLNLGATLQKEETARGIQSDVANLISDTAQIVLDTEDQSIIRDMTKAKTSMEQGRGSSASFNSRMAVGTRKLFAKYPGREGEILTTLHNLKLASPEFALVQEQITLENEQRAIDQQLHQRNLEDARQAGVLQYIDNNPAMGVDDQATLKALGETRARSAARTQALNDRGLFVEKTTGATKEIVRNGVRVKWDSEIFPSIVKDLNSKVGTLVTNINFLMQQPGTSEEKLKQITQTREQLGNAIAQYKAQEIYGGLFANSAEPLNSTERKWMIDQVDEMINNSFLSALGVEKVSDLDALKGTAQTMSYATANQTIDLWGDGGSELNYIHSVMPEMAPQIANAWNFSNIPELQSAGKKTIGSLMKALKEGQPVGITSPFDPDMTFEDIRGNTKISSAELNRMVQGGNDITNEHEANWWVSNVNNVISGISAKTIDGASTSEERAQLSRLMSNDAFLKQLDKASKFYGQDTQVIGKWIHDNILQDTLTVARGLQSKPSLEGLGLKQEGGQLVLDAFGVTLTGEQNNPALRRFFQTWQEQDTEGGGTRFTMRETEENLARIQQINRNLKIINRMKNYAGKYSDMSKDEYSQFLMDFITTPTQQTTNTPTQQTTEPTAEVVTPEPQASTQPQGSDLIAEYIQGLSNQTLQDIIDGKAIREGRDPKMTQFTVDIARKELESRG